MKSIPYTEMKYMLTVRETAKILGTSIHTVYRLIESGELKCKKNNDNCRRNRTIYQRTLKGDCICLQTKKSLPVRKSWSS